MTDSTRDAGSPPGESAGLSPADALPSQLSAFMDDQLPAAESDLFVRRLVRDAEMKQCMSRYLLIGEALRQPSNRQQAGVSRDFSARIAAALEQDQAAPKSNPLRSTTSAHAIWKNVAGLAVAAGVAAIALLVVRHPGELPGAQTTTLAGAGSSASDSYIVPAVATGPAAPIPAARLTNYVVAHSEFSSPLGRQNLMTGLLSEDRQLADAQTVANVDEAGEAAQAEVVDR